MSQELYKNIDHLKYRAKDILQQKDILARDEYVKQLENIIISLTDGNDNTNITSPSQKSINPTINNKELKQQFNILFDQAIEGYCILNSNGEIELYNTAFSNIFNIPAQNLRHQKLETIIHHGNQNNFFNHREVIKGNSDNYTSIINYYRYGQIIPVKLQTRVISLGAEQKKTILCTLIEMNTNIQHYHNLYRSEARFRSLVESIIDVIFTVDQNLNHTGVFGKWVIFDKRTPEKFLGKSAREILGTEMGTFHENHFKQALKGEHIVYEWSYMTSEGRKHIQTSLSPIYFNNDLNHYHLPTKNGTTAFLFS
jgi:PAS domain-containing protein